MPNPDEKEPSRSPFEPELEDEGPGSYLAELGTRRASVVWGALNFLATAGLGVTSWASNLGPSSEWFTVARLAWCLLPVSALILLIVTVWQLGTAYTAKPPSRVIPALLLPVASIVLWALFARGLGVLPGE